MIRLASIITAFEAAFLSIHGTTLSDDQRRALGAMKLCRTELSPKMQAACTACNEQRLVPHSCGHRHCPHCQAHESQQWIERQLKKHLPCDYFLITFTLPAELRPLALKNQPAVYARMMQCAWDTLNTFSHNDRQLQGTPGAVAVLHTHSRRLDYHPHVHVVMPAGAIDVGRRRWRTKRGKKHYLFNHKALAKVFRAKLLEALTGEGLALPARYAKAWVVDSKHVGGGDKALVYLGRYLYRGVIQEKDILACEGGQVTFRYRNGKTRCVETRTVSGVEFLRLVLSHILPKGFRRARNFGFLHPNSKRLIALLQLLHRLVPTLPPTSPRPPLTCRCCGANMIIVRTRIIPVTPPPPDNTGSITMM